MVGGQGYTSRGGSGTACGGGAHDGPGSGDESAQGTDRAALNVGSGGYHSARMGYSQSLLAQSEAKEREAAALRRQGLEPLEAEKLEKAAVAAREHGEFILYQSFLWP
jgi:hypothetical protein